MSTTPPGWYDDGNGAMRWWDGQGWTEHTHVPEAEPAASEQVPAYAQAHAPHAQGQQPYGQVVPEQAPTKKRGWVLPVIIGGSLLVLGTIALVIFLAVQVFSTVQSSAGGNGMTSPSMTASPSDAPSTAPSAEVSSPPTETIGEDLPLDHPATETVADYDQAYKSEDCALYEATTTQDYRGDQTCDEFVVSAEEFNAGLLDYTVVIDRVIDVGSGSVIVETTESYTTVTDGTESDYEDVLAYVLIQEDGVWLIDNFTDPFTE